MNSVEELKECLCCSCENLRTVLDLGTQPLANNLKKTQDQFEEKFPLILKLCERCFHLQLSHCVDPDLLFRNYLYVSGTTETLKKYFDWFVKFVMEYSKLEYGSVLDIACNDGTQLDFFQKYGWKTSGIDPSENLYKISSQKNHKIICNYFDSKYFNEKFDIIVAQNVFAHNKNTKQFLDHCYELMNDNSLLFIQTSQSEMIINNEFDTIYHEHLSFFNINSFYELCKRTKLNLIDVIKTPIHGISYLFVLSRKKINTYLIENLINIEKTKGLLDHSTYINYNNNVLNLVKNFKECIDNFKQNNYKIIGYGAAAKGMTFLNFANIKMDFIIDDNYLKQGLFTPYHGIEIKSIDILNTYNQNDKIVFVPLAWNFFDEIKHRIKKIRNNPEDIYIKYFPKLIIN